MGIDTGAFEPLLGTLVVFAIFALVAGALLREAARYVVRGLLLVAIVVGVSVWAGWLDQTRAEGIFRWIGDGLLTGIRAVTGWLVAAWGTIGG